MSREKYSRIPSILEVYLCLVHSQAFPRVLANSELGNYWERFRYCFDCFDYCMLSLSSSSKISPYYKKVKHTQLLSTKSLSYIHSLLLSISINDYFLENEMCFPEYLLTDFCNDCLWNIRWI